jgi:hypothetical protein
MGFAEIDQSSFLRILLRKIPWLLSKYLASLLLSTVEVFAVMTTSLGIYSLMQHKMAPGAIALGLMILMQRGVVFRREYTDMLQVEPHGSCVNNIRAHMFLPKNLASFAMAAVLLIFGCVSIFR